MDLLDDDTWTWIDDVCPEEARLAFGDIVPGSYCLDDIYDDLVGELEDRGFERYVEEDDLRSCIRRAFSVRFCDDSPENRDP